MPQSHADRCSRAAARFCCTDFALHRLHRNSIATMERHDGHEQEGH
ncbi:hypothetical protein RSPO_c01715 [Ralstonia solanacearum Po82]|uniref:Uncharacterized protein n=1 Tax=Ralstonia solanacearum (strain Po82) TaxID=1031711 RepID=F6G0U7_RALS8|nr:hypothetical protein RSPO_c01715 [Ralstonia solanacearum Po82]